MKILKNINIKKINITDKTWFYILLGVPFAFLLLVTVVPLVFSLGVSFFKWNLAVPGSLKFIGISNYLKIITSDIFWNSVFNTFSMVVASVSLQLFIGMIMALLLTRKIKSVKLLRSLYLIPMMTTPIVVGLTWRILFSADFGFINYLLSLFGIQSINWLGNPLLAMPSLIITDIWRSTPFVTMIFIAGLQSLPNDIYEAAKVDGAKSYESFKFITLPLMKPFIWLAILFRVMDVIRKFDTIYVMTGGGPGRATETLNMFAYFQAFECLNIGYGSGLAMLMLFVIFMLRILILRKTDMIS